jgi:hypothetical protein
MTVELAEGEAAALEAQAVRAGFPDGRAFAGHLIREGLRGAGMPPAEAQAPGPAGAG